MASLVMRFEQWGKDLAFVVDNPPSNCPRCGMPMSVEEIHKHFCHRARGRTGTRRLGQRAGVGPHGPRRPAR